MKVTKEDTLPPCIDVTGNANKEYWLSPAIPWLPVHDSDGKDDFSGLVLTALLVRDGKGRKFVETRLERRQFMLKADGTASMDAIGQTIAFGAMPLKKFLESTDVTPGQRASSRIFTFYENDMDVITASVAGGIPYDAQIVVNVCRGYDKPKSFVAGCNYANMTFLFNEGNKSFEKWRKGLECPEEVVDYKHRAIVHAEKIGVYEFKVNGKYMEYWSFFGNEGWYFIRHDLDDGKDVFRGANIPWDGVIPAFLMTETGATLYNYMEG